MKKGLLATTALIGVGVLSGGAALAAEAPEWKLSGNMNFQFYWVDQDNQGVDSSSWTTATGDTGFKFTVWDTTARNQDHEWYFGVDEAELALNVSGVADNGLKYGFKIELQTNTSDSTNVDEARISLGGNWGTLQLGDEDGAEDSMNYGGENLMGATGGFDGDQGDFLYRAGTLKIWSTGGSATWTALAPSGPSIAGDTSDQTKVTYYSPRFSGFQVGASLTPTPNNGDDFKADGDWENHYGLGANYDNTFGGVRIRASGVYSASSSNIASIEDVAAWSVGGIVGFGSFSIAANYTDNSDSGQFKGALLAPGLTNIESSHWNAAAQFATGPMTFAIGYFEGTTELPAVLAVSDSTYTHVALTADYKVAPGLNTYAEINLIEDEILGGVDPEFSNDTTAFILGVEVSF